MTRGLWKNSSPRDNEGVSKKNRQRRKSGSESAPETETPSVGLTTTNNSPESLLNSKELLTEPTPVDSSTLERTANVKKLTTSTDKKSDELENQPENGQQSTQLQEEENNSTSFEDSTLERIPKSQTKQSLDKDSGLEKSSKIKKQNLDKLDSTLEKTQKNKKQNNEKESTLEKASKNKDSATLEKATKNRKKSIEKDSTLEKGQKNKKKNNDKDTLEKSTKNKKSSEKKQKNKSEQLESEDLNVSSKESSEESGLITLGKLPPPVDSKYLQRDELFDLLQSTSEETPSNLKTTVIRSSVASKPSELTVKKNDVVFVLFKKKELLYVKNKKGAKGFIPFVCTSCSVDEPSSKKSSKKVRRKSVDSVTNETNKKLPAATAPKEAKFVPLNDHPSTTRSGSPFIQHSSVELLSSVESIIKREEEKYHTLKSGKVKDNQHRRSRSKSFDQLANQRPGFDSREDVFQQRDLERPSTSLERPDSQLDPGFVSDFSEISKDSSFERILSPFTRRKSKKASHGSDKDMNKLKFFSRNKNKSSKEKLSGRHSDSSNKVSDSEVSSASTTKIVKKNNKKNTTGRGRTLSATEQFDWYSNLFTDNVSSESSDSEDDSTTTDTESIRVYQKKTSSIKTENIFDYERFRSLDRSKVRRSSDTSASSDFYVPQRVIPKTSIHEQSNMNDKRLTKSSAGFAQIHKTNTVQTKKKIQYVDAPLIETDDKVDNNNSSNNNNIDDGESSIDIAANKSEDVTTSEDANNTATNTTPTPTDTTDNITNANHSVALNDNNKNSSSTNDKTKNNTLPPTNLKKTRLSSSNNSLRSSTRIKKKNYSSDNEIERLHSPLKATKASQPVTDPLKEKITKSYHCQHSQIQRHNPTAASVAVENSRMIVSYDFIASEETDVTILTGQQVEVLRKPDIDWWWVRTTDGREGFVPRSFLAQIPTVPSRKPDLLKRLNSSPENDINNNMNYTIGMEARAAISLPSSSYLSRDTSKLAMVAPLRRTDVPVSAQIDDIALYKKMHMSEMYGGMNNNHLVAPAPPSYNQYMMTRQKSDLSDRYHVNKKRYLEEYQHKQNITKNWKSQEDFSPIEATHDPGGASRIVRRRSFSGRQKKVRFANDISPNDKQYQNSPGQILIIRQTNSALGNYPTTDSIPYRTQPADDQEDEIATWC